MPEATLVYNGLREKIHPVWTSRLGKENNLTITLTLSRDSPGPSGGIHQSAFLLETKAPKNPDNEKPLQLWGLCLMSDRKDLVAAENWTSVLFLSHA